MTDFLDDIPAAPETQDPYSIWLQEEASKPQDAPEALQSEEAFLDQSDERVRLLQEKVAQLVKGSGLNQQELAEKTGLSQSQISRWLSSNSKGIPMHALLRIAEHLEIDWHRLLNMRDFPVWLPPSTSPKLDLVPLGKKENELAAIHIKDLDGITLFLGPERAGSRHEVFLRCVLGLAQRCQPLILVEDGSGLAGRALEEIEKQSPHLLGQVVELDFQTEPVPINFLQISSRKEIPGAVAAFREIMRVAEQDSDPMAARITEAAITALLEAQLLIENDASINLFDSRLFMSDFEFRQLIVNFAEQNVVQRNFDVDSSHWETDLSESKKEALLAPFYRLLDILDDLATGASGLGASKNILPKALRENIVLVRLPENPVAAQVVFSLIARELQKSSERRFCAFDNFTNYAENLGALLKKNNISFLLSAENLHKDQQSALAAQSNRCLHFMQTPTGLWAKSTPQNSSEDFLIEERDGSFLSCSTPEEVPIAKGSALHEHQLQNYHRSWLRGEERATPIRNSAAEVRRVSGELSAEGPEDRMRIHNIKALLSNKLASSLAQFSSEDFDPLSIESLKEEVDWSE